MRLRDIQAHYAETIKGTDPALLLEATRAYISSLSEQRYISQASKVLETRMWDKPEFKPKPDQNLNQLLTLEALAKNYPPDSTEGQYYPEAIKEERERLMRQGYVEDGAGGLKLPELTPEQRKSRADAYRRNEYLRYA